MALLYVVTTGGTIEKVYSEQQGVVANLDGKIDRYLRLLRLPDSEVRVVPLMNIDSLDMTDADRARILETVKGLLPEKAPILITHGTDTMVETGLYFAAWLAEAGSSNRNDRSHGSARFRRQRRPAEFDRKPFCSPRPLAGNLCCKS
jgi:L-asparaginase